MSWNSTPSWLLVWLPMGLLVLSVLYLSFYRIRKGSGEAHEEVTATSPSTPGASTVPSGGHGHSKGSSWGWVLAVAIVIGVIIGVMAIPADWRPQLPLGNKKASRTTSSPKGVVCPVAETLTGKTDVWVERPIVHCAFNASMSPEEGGYKLEFEDYLGNTVAWKPEMANTNGYYTKARVMVPEGVTLRIWFREF